MQQRPEMSVVENAPTDGQQIGERCAAQRIRPISKPFRQGGVHADDAPVRVSDDVPTRGVLPEVFDAAVGHVDRANAAIAEAVASGALTCGQWPTAARVTRRLSGMCAST